VLDGVSSLEVFEEPRDRMAGVLDTARFRTFIAQELDVSVSNVTAMVLGGHGDTMVPIARLTSVSGIPLSELLDQAAIDRLIDRARKWRRRNREVSENRQRLLHSFSRRGGMVESILKDKKKVLPCAAFLEGEYGIKDLFVGVPVSSVRAGSRIFIKSRCCRTNRRHWTRARPR